MLLRQDLRGQDALVLGIVAIAAGLLLGLLSVWVSPIWTLWLLLGIAFVALAIKRPELFVLAYLVITASFIQQTKAQSISIGVGTIYFTDLILFACLGLILIRSLAEPRFRLVGTPLDVPLLIFLLTSLASTALAVWNGSVPFLFSLGESRVVASYLLFFAITNLIRSKQQVTWLIEAVLLLATVVAVVTVAQYLIGQSAVVLAGRIESVSAQTDVFRVIPLGQSVLVIAFLALVVLLLLEKPGLFNLARYLECGIIGVAILITFFRASWVAVGICILILAFILRERERQRFTLWLLVALAVIGLAVLAVAGQPGSRGASFMSSLGDRFASIADPASYTDPDSSLRWRDFEYSYAIPRVIQNFADPFIGLGYGAQYRPLMPPRDWAGFDGRGYIHNGFLWVMLKSGILGFVGLFWFLVAILVRGLRYWRTVPDARLRATLLAFALVALVVLIVTNVEPYVMEAGWPPMIAVVAGINEVIIRRFRTASPTEVSPA